MEKYSQHPPMMAPNKLLAKSLETFLEFRNEPANMIPAKKMGKDKRPEEMIIARWRSSPRKTSGLSSQFKKSENISPAYIRRVLILLALST